jgi:hypothetical protein
LVARPFPVNVTRISYHPDQRAMIVDPPYTWRATSSDSNHHSNMQFFQHHFPTVEQYLQHRPPYLLVDRLTSCSPTDTSCSPTDVVTEKTVTGDEFFLGGHFPGAPIFPGAMMQELTTQSAGILIAAQYNPMQAYDTSDPQI